MKIALIGYGKMGRAIEEVAVQQGHEIILKIDVNNLQDFNYENMQQADAAIEFTSPHTAYENVKKLLEYNIPTVCGSTGWLDKLPEVTALCKEKNGSFISATNFSIGVNIFFELNKKLAAMMHNRPEYQVALEEIHHTAKKDAPSGTAITLAEGVLESYIEKTKWVNDIVPAGNELLITSKRIDPAPGTHSVMYTSPIDDITITHTAHNRVGFASGAVAAAAYIYNKKGIFTMKDVLGL